MVVVVQHLSTSVVGWGEGVKLGCVDHMLDVDQLAHTEPGNAILSCDSANCATSS